MRGLWEPSPHPPDSEPPGKRAPRFGQRRPPEGEPAAEEGPRATHRRISNHLSNPPLPENRQGHADMGGTHWYLSPRGPGIPGQSRGACEGRGMRVGRTAEQG